jgi:two-component system, cell cycle response regulator
MPENKKLDISVLYVEDDQETRDGVADSLRLHIKEIDTAKDGREGLTLFKNKKYHIVITDIKMPVMNGLEMSREIKALNKKTPVIITTAYNDTEFLIECIDIGVNQFILKPIIMNRLMDSINKCIKING